MKNDKIYYNYIGENMNKITSTINMIINNKINSIDEITNIVNENQMEFLNEVIKVLSKRDYEIISINPLRVKKNKTV